jgi:hypothetical protein
VLVSLIIKDETIKNPKWIVMPRKSTFLHIKWQIRETFASMKDYLDEEMRIWRLEPELTDTEFIDQYNNQFSNK